MERAPERLCLKCGKCCKEINCKYLRYDNACMIYKDRPEDCVDYPFDIWKDVPDGCGYEGWIFMQREKEKQKVRFKKEQIISIKLRMRYAPSAKKALLKKEIDELNDFINKYSEYGSEDW